MTLAKPSDDMATAWAFDKFLETGIMQCPYCQHKPYKYLRRFINHVILCKAGDHK